MQQKILIVLVLLYTVRIVSQTQADSVKIYKHEVGINLLPLVNSGYATFNAFYKRQLNSKFFGRFSLILLNVEKENTILKTIPISSSTIGIEFTKGNPKQYLQFNLGVEKRFRKRKIQQFVGIDFGYGRYQYGEAVMFGKREGILKNQAYANTQNELNEQLKNDSIVSKYTITSNVFTTSPFYGLQFNVTKHLFFSAQLGFNFSYNNVSKNYSIDNKPFKSEDFDLSNFDFRFSTVSSNFSICYRF